MHHGSKEYHRNEKRQRYRWRDQNCKLIEIYVLTTKQHNTRSKSCKCSTQNACSHLGVGLLHPRASLGHRAMHICRGQMNDVIDGKADCNHDTNGFWDAKFPLLKNYYCHYRHNYNGNTEHRYQRLNQVLRRNQQNDKNENYRQQYSTQRLWDKLLLSRNQSPNYSCCLEKVGHAGWSNLPLFLSELLPFLILWLLDLVWLILEHTCLPDDFHVYELVELKANELFVDCVLPILSIHGPER